MIPILGGRERFVASAVIVGFCLLQWRGIRIGDVAQQPTSLLKAVALIGLAAVALIVSGGMGTAGGQRAADPAMPSGGLLAASMVLALQSAIYTYDGWTGPINFGEEVKDPGRNIPRSMIGGVLLVLAIYLALNAAFLRVLSIEEMAGDPFVAATAASRLMGPSGDTILRVLMIVSLTAAVNALQLMASRVPHAMSRDRLLPSLLGRVNAGGTPVPSLFAGTAVALVFVVTNTLDTVLALLAFFFVANYALTFTSFFVLRHRDPDAPRPFKVPAYPWPPLVALLGSLASSSAPCSAIRGTASSRSGSWRPAGRCTR